MGMQGLLIGDVFFRSYMVEFDMSSKERPTIGIGLQNPGYTPISKGQLGLFKIDEAPLQRLMLLRGEETMYSAEHSARLREVDQVPIFNKKGTQYFMDISVG
jgi:hypothetical protein